MNDVVNDVSVREGVLEKARRFLSTYIEAASVFGELRAQIVCFGEVDTILDVEAVHPEGRRSLQEGLVREPSVLASMHVFESWMFRALDGEARPPGQVKDMPGRREGVGGVLLFASGGLVFFTQLLGTDRKPDGPLEEIGTAERTARVSGRMVPAHRSSEEEN